MKYKQRRNFKKFVAYIFSLSLFSESQVSTNLYTSMNHAMGTQNKDRPLIMYECIDCIYYFVFAD